MRPSCMSAPCVVGAAAFCCCCVVGAGTFCGWRPCGCHCVYGGPCGGCHTSWRHAAQYAASVLSCAAVVCVSVVLGAEPSPRRRLRLRLSGQPFSPARSGRLARAPGIYRVCWWPVVADLRLHLRLRWGFVSCLERFHRLGGGAVRRRGGLAASGGCDAAPGVVSPSVAGVKISAYLSVKSLIRCAVAGTVDVRWYSPVTRFLLRSPLPSPMPTLETDSAWWWRPCTLLLPRRGARKRARGLCGRVVEQC